MTSLTPDPTRPGTEGEEMRPYVLVKRGLYWRPDAMGYTGVLAEAGLYTEADARARADGDGTTMQLASEATEFAPACWQETKIAVQSQRIARLLSDLAAAREERDAARRENNYLRASLANGSGPCAYCKLPKEEWSKCAAGFPGCDRADDAMLCPHVGGELAGEAEASALRARVAKLEEALQSVRDRVLNPICLGISDTFWMTEHETVVDFINWALIPPEQGKLPLSSSDPEKQT